MTNVEKEIEKARRKPLAGEKLKELLLKLRKGATGTLTFGKLVNVVDAVNWGIEGVLGWVPIHYEARGDKKAMPIQVPRSRFSSDAQFQGAHEDLLRVAAHSELPDAPAAPGERLIMNVSEIKNSSDNHYAYFNHDEWRGSEGIVVETSGGDVSPPIVHDRYTMEGHGRDVPPGRLVLQIWKWMMSNGVEEAIASALDMEVHVPAAERTRENTGTCPACWGNYKLDGRALVMHGYRRPGYGYIQGSCFGVGYGPVEATKHGLVDVWEKLLTPDLEETNASVEKIETGEVTQIEGRRGETIKKGEVSFDHLLETMLRQLKQKAKQLEQEINTYDKLIAAWKPRPMPREGEPQRSMGFFLK